VVVVVAMAVAEEATVVVEVVTEEEVVVDTAAEVVDLVVVRNLTTFLHCSCQCSQVLVDTEEVDMGVAALLEACFDEI
jgi:hypothetical protein